MEICVPFRLTAPFTVSQQRCFQFSSAKLGVGTKLGCEATSYATRAFANFPPLSPKVTPKLDLWNALNSVSRDAVHSSVTEKIPQRYRSAWQAYREPFFHSFGDQIITSFLGGGRSEQDSCHCKRDG